MTDIDRHGTDILCSVDCCCHYIIQTTIHITNCVSRSTSYEDNLLFLFYNKLSKNPSCHDDNNRKKNRIELESEIKFEEEKSKTLIISHIVVTIFYR